MNAKKAAEGLELIAIGAVLLANTVGGLPWAVWVSVFSLWPIWLVAAGVDLIGKSTDRAWLRVLSSLLMVAALLYGAFVMVPGTWRFPLVIRSAAGSQAVSQTEAHSDSVDLGTVKIGVGATDLTIHGGSDLAALTGDSPTGLEPQLTAGIDGRSADVTLDYRRGSTVWIPGSVTNQLRLALDRTVRWKSLELDAGATKASIDLTGLQVDEVIANVGAADTTITFAEGRDCKARIAGGVANVTLRVPKRSTVNLDTQGILNTDVPSDFGRSGSWGDRTWAYTGGSGAVIDISVQGGIANVKVETY
jgi:hypothetical protein